MNRDTKIQKLREAIAAQTVAYPTISQAEAIYDAVFSDETGWEYGIYSAVMKGVQSVGAPWIDHEYALRVTANESGNYGVRRTRPGAWEAVE